MSAVGFTLTPSADKVEKWLRVLKEAVGSKVLAAGDASKLSGKLAWGSAHMFRHVLMFTSSVLSRSLCMFRRRFGRALLRPIFDQMRRRDGKVDSELLRALGWWIKVLELGIVERIAWSLSSESPVHLFCDASSNPAHLGAVIFYGGAWMWTHMAVPKSLLDCFQHRNDGQIMGLELLAVSLGLCSFVGMLRGRKVIVHCDNRGSEVPF